MTDRELLIQQMAQLDNMSARSAPNCRALPFTPTTPTTPVVPPTNVPPAGDDLWQRGRFARMTFSGPRRRPCCLLHRSPRRFLPSGPGPDLRRQRLHAGLSRRERGRHSCGHGRSHSGHSGKARHHGSCERQSPERCVCEHPGHEPIVKPTTPAWKPIGVPGYKVRAEDFTILIPPVRRIRYVTAKSAC
jgi:hypothetical protein